MIEQFYPYIVMLIVLGLVWFAIKIIRKLTAKIFSCGCVVLVVIVILVFVFGRGIITF